MYSVSGSSGALEISSELIVARTVAHLFFRLCLVSKRCLFELFLFALTASGLRREVHRHVDDPGGRKSAGEDGRHRRELQRRTETRQSKWNAEIQEDA